MTTNNEFTDDTLNEPVPVAPVTPTQVARPWHAVVRTIFAAVVSAAVLLPLMLPVLEAWSLEQTWLPSEFNTAVAAITTIIVAVTGLITRLLAVPGVNAWLRKYVPFLAA